MKIKTSAILYSFLFVALLFSCKKKNGGGLTDQRLIESQLNSGLMLPAGSFTVDPDSESISVDNSISVGSSSGAPMALQIGQPLTASIPFNAPNGNVSAIGMRFGTTGPINFVPINTNNAISGTGNFQFQVTPEMCANLSKLCHDVRCYEFAYTGSGQISQANLTQIALMCGNCDEPSCKGLIDEEACSIDCDLINDFSSGSGFYFDNFTAKQETFISNPTEQTCNAYYDSVILWYQAILQCSGDTTFQGTSIQSLINDLKSAQNDLCPSF